jgi:hypothetical protein
MTWWLTLFALKRAGHKSNESAKVKRRPAFGEPVWVQCDGFRCLACWGTGGRWRTFYDGKELSGVVKVLPDQFTTPVHL